MKGRVKLVMTYNYRCVLSYIEKGVLWAYDVIHLRAFCNCTCLYTFSLVGGGELKLMVITICNYKSFVGEVLCQIPFVIA